MYMNILCNSSCYQKLYVGIVMKTDQSNYFMMHLMCASYYNSFIIMLYII